MDLRDALLRNLLGPSGRPQDPEIIYQSPAANWHGYSPKRRQNATFSEVVTFVERHIRHLARDEINVTKRLAGPYGETGGLMVLLQQPAEIHPFHDGTAATIRQCKTLQQLHHLFHTVSLGLIGIANINVLDLSPFIRPSDAKVVESPVQRNLQDRVLELIRACKPAVIICASKSRVD